MPLRNLSEYTRHWLRRVRRSWFAYGFCVCVYMTALCWLCIKFWSASSPYPQCNARRPTSGLAKFVNTGNGSSILTLLCSVILKNNYLFIHSNCPVASPGMGHWSTCYPGVWCTQNFCNRFLLVLMGLSRILKHWLLLLWQAVAKNFSRIRRFCRPNARWLSLLDDFVTTNFGTPAPRPPPARSKILAMPLWLSFTTNSLTGRIMQTKQQIPKTGSRPARSASWDRANVAIHQLSLVVTLCVLVFVGFRRQNIVWKHGAQQCSPYNADFAPIFCRTFWSK